jgi:3-oxoacyl-[acyl-carrier-protein] synthase I
MVVKRERIYITGTGAVCGSGMNPVEILAAVREGRSSIRPIEQWDASTWGTRYAAEVPGYNPRKLVEDRKLHKFIRRTDLLGIYAGSQAADTARLAPFRDSLDPDAARTFCDRTGCYVGSGGGAYENQYDYFPLITQAGGDLVRFGSELGDVVNPMWLLRTLPNNVLCHVGIKYNLKGANACITNHSISGTLAVIEAAEALRNDEADRAVAIGHDAPIEPQNVMYYQRCGLLGRGAAIRPFDAERDGSLFGEGAAALTLETEASAKARDAKPLGEVLGGGAASEAVGLLAIREDGDGLARAMRAALDDAGLAPDDIGMIVGHANGTPLSDASEATAIARVFGRAIPPVTGFKWAFGHLIAAAGIIDAVLALDVLREGTVPGIATLSEVAPECAMLPLSNTAQKARSGVAMILCRGFAGTDAALIVRAL